MATQLQLRLTLKTINSDIYPHVKHFGCVVNTDFTPTSIVLVNLLFCFNILTLLARCRLGMKNHFIFGRVCCLFSTEKWVLKTIPTAFCVLVFVCSPIQPAVPTASYLWLTCRRGNRGKAPLWILRGAQEFSLLTGFFPLPYGVQALS